MAANASTDRIKIIIDYMNIIISCELELAAGVLEAALDGRFVVGSPGAEPVLEYVQVGHLDENEQGVGNFPSDLKPSLHVDHQNDAGSLLSAARTGSAGVP